MYLVIGTKLELPLRGSLQYYVFKVDYDDANDKEEASDHDGDARSTQHVCD